VSDFILDASLTLQWFLEDEADRKYSLSVLALLAENTALAPPLRFYEVGNGLVMALRRRRITAEQIVEFLERLRALPVRAVEQPPEEVLELPAMAQKFELTNYDAAYLAAAIRLNLPLATTDQGLRRAASLAGVSILSA